MIDCTGTKNHKNKEQNTALHSMNTKYKQVNTVIANNRTICTLIRLRLYRPPAKKRGRPILTAPRSTHESRIVSQMCTVGDGESHSRNLKLPQTLLIVSLTIRSRCLGYRSRDPIKPGPTRDTSSLYAVGILPSYAACVQAACISDGPRHKMAEIF